MLIGFGLLSCFSSFAATSTAWDVAGFNDLLKGRLSGLSLTAAGSLQLGPSVRWQTTLDQPALWSLAAAPDHSIYASTGHQGKVFRIGPDGKWSLAWTAEQSEVFALCTTESGVLYAGTSPNGGLYRIENGKAREIWHSPVKYIWAIQSTPDGALYVATGEQGRIYRVEPDGKAEVYYETGQYNVTALKLATNGHLYAGTDPNGILYDISGAKQGSILFDSDLPEIRSIAVDPNGNIYAAAMGGAVSTRSTAPQPTATTSSGGAVIAATPTVITVTEAKRNPADNDQANVKPPADQTKGTSSPSSTGGVPSNTAVTEVAGVVKSAIYRISPSHTVETLRSSKDDNVYDLFLDGGSLVFSTDDRGRIYTLDDRKITLLVEPGSGEATRLLQTGGVIYAALSNPARLFAFAPAGSGGGFYESQVHDCTSVARWGRLQWHGPSGQSSGVIFRTRSGNTARPDTTWSSWSEPIADPADALIKSPAARFVQLRAEWPAGSTAQISNVAVPYLPRNGPPAIRSITVSGIIGTNTAKATANATASSTAYSVTVTETGEAPAATTTSSPSQTVSRLQTTQTQISWQADDPDGDKLVYSVYFRAEDENDWQLIRSHMFENTLLLDPDVFADGHYLFRVIASDTPANAAQYARETEMVSPPVLIDNTPPLVTLGPPQRNATSLDIDIEAADKVSPLRLCEYSLDAGIWQPIEAVDGVTDSPREKFHLHLDKLRPGEHLLVFRVYDSANNAGLARVVLH